MLPTRTTGILFLLGQLVLASHPDGWPYPSTIKVELFQQNHGQLSYDLGQDTFNNEIDKVLLKKMNQTKILQRKGCSVTFQQDLIN